MSPKVWWKVARKTKEKVVLQSYPEIEDEVLDLERQEDVDWTSLPDDMVIQLFSCTLKNYWFKYDFFYLLYFV